MLQAIVMPKLGETMEEGTVQQWRVSVGDAVRKGDIIMDVETDKAVIEVESLVEGILRLIVVEAGQTVPIGHVLAYAGDPQDALPDQTKGLAPAAGTVKQHSSPMAAPVAPGSIRRGEDVVISPRARKLAESVGIDITQVRGSGPGGRIVSEDIEAIRDQRQPVGASKPAAVAAAPGTRWIPHSLPRRKTAEMVTQSWTTIPCFDLTVEAKADALVDLRSRLNATGDHRIAVHDLLIVALARALRQFEVLTGSWSADGVTVPANYGIGLAVATPQGLAAPVIRDVRDLSLAQVAERSAALVEKARARQLAPDDLAGACTTVSNLGMLGIDHFRPIVVPGQGSILGVGRIRQAVAAEDGTVAVQRVMSLTLVVDHRLTDGEYAARFLGAVKNHLEQPEPLSS